MKNDIEELLNNEKIKRMFLNRNFMEVFYGLELYIKTLKIDSVKVIKLRNLLFIEYLKTIKVRKHSNYYERLLITFINIENSNEIINYLLKQDINMSYMTTINDVKVSLNYLLAIKIKDKTIMKLLLEKVINKRYLFIQNGNFSETNDLVRMNIIAGNIDDALKYFSSKNYKLINEANIEVINPINYLKTNKKMILKRFNYKYDDILYQLLLTIKESDNSLEDKRNLLITILNSNKINLFNTFNLVIIKQLLDPEMYNNFIDYLRKKEANNEITLYNQSLDGVINYIKLDDILVIDNLVRK